MWVISFCCFSGNPIWVWFCLLYVVLLDFYVYTHDTGMCWPWVIRNGSSWRAMCKLNHWPEELNILTPFRNLVKLKDSKGSPISKRGAKALLLCSVLRGRYEGRDHHHQKPEAINYHHCFFLENYLYAPHKHTPNIIQFICNNKWINFVKLYLSLTLECENE